ncbi:MAG: DUF2207 domain-containing protein [bacterium]|nr:DUF2207 domain-containing protein [bacterium]
MRKIIFTFFITLFFIPFISFAQSERITDFTASIDIQKDASFDVTEVIMYDFGSQERHGIYRNIPVKYKTEDGRTRLIKISDIRVHDGGSSNPSLNNYRFEKSNVGNDLQIKIGDPDKYVTGLKKYVLNYTVKGAINNFDDHTEFYWNVTGNNWNVPIEKARAYIVLPGEVGKESLQASCYKGPVGANTTCGSLKIETEMEKTFNYTIADSPINSLGPNEGLTVALGFPKGVVAEKEYLYEVPFLSTFWGKVWLVANIVLPIAAFIIIFAFWRKKGRDPRGRGTIIAEYDAPDGVDPVAVGTLVDEKVDKKDISAGIIDMAVKGYLKINRLDGKGIFKTKDYELTKLKGSQGLADYERKIFDALFASGNTVKLKDLDASFATDVKEAQKLVFESLVAQGYFAKSPQKVRNIYLVVGFIVLFAGFAAMMLAPSLIAVGVIILIFSFFMPARTLKGVYAKEHILGLKEYLSVAEKDRIKFHNAPEKNPQTFEKYLPYAMALGVEKEWAKQFEGIFKENPSWYNDPSMSTFSAVAFASSMDNFSTSAGAVSVPASSGGSGLGGGGFSGGGMGGGGGGSW